MNALIEIDSFISDNWGTEVGKTIYEKRRWIDETNTESIARLYNFMIDKGYIDGEPIVLKKFHVGVYVDNYCDQQYLRDRDETIYEVDEKAAIKRFVILREGWLKQEEYKYIRVKEIV